MSEQNPIKAASRHATNKDILNALKSAIVVPAYVRGVDITLRMDEPPEIVWHTLPEKTNP